MPPEPAAGSETLARLDSSSSTSCVLRATRRANGIRQSQRQRVRQHRDGVGTGKARRKGRHGRAQHVHIGVALGQHAPGGFGGNESRLWREPAGLFDARPELPQRAELCHGQELIGIRGQAEGDRRARSLQPHAAGFQHAQIADGKRQREGKLLRFRAAGIMHRAAVGEHERPLEAAATSGPLTTLANGFSISRQSAAALPRTAMVESA